MQLTPKQLEMQEAILLAVYPGYTFEEAKEKESGIIGCIRDGGCVTSYSSLKAKDFYVIKQFLGTELYLDLRQCVGLPPTLSRVLTALGDEYFYKDGGINKQDYAYNDDGDRIYYDDEICDRTLLKDGVDATLRDQSQETQDAIHSIICKK